MLYGVDIWHEPANASIMPAPQMEIIFKTVTYKGKVIDKGITMLNFDYTSHSEYPSTEKVMNGKYTSILHYTTGMIV